MVQRLVTNNGTQQAGIPNSAVETLSRASSCNSTLTSIADTLEKIKNCEKPTHLQSQQRLLQTLPTAPTATKKLRLLKQQMSPQTSLQHKPRKMQMMAISRLQHQ
jgi:hypothetical protein